jgi:hypothetical protein
VLQILTQLPVSCPACPLCLPLELIFCPAPLRAVQVGGCSLWFNGSFYDNLSVNRRGVTSLNWPKPKIKIDSKQGSVRGDQACATGTKSSKA